MERKIITKKLPAVIERNGYKNDPNAATKAGAPSNHAFKELMIDESEFDEDNIPDYDARGIKPPVIANVVTYNQIVDDIRLGLHPTVAAQSAGIHYQTLKTYLERGRSGVNKLYYNFWKDCQQAWAQAERTILTRLQAHETMDWRASAWRLERQWPERYALKTISRSEVNVTGEIEHKVKEDLANKVLDDTTARELARSLLSKPVAKSQNYYYFL